MSGARPVVLEVLLYRDSDPLWAEWDLFEDAGDRLGWGTAPSLESAVDAAMKQWWRVETGAEDPAPPKKGGGSSNSP